MAYILSPLSIEELTEEIGRNSNGIDAITSLKFDKLGLLCFGQNNIYGYTSWKLPVIMYEELLRLIDGSHKGDNETLKFAWYFYYKIAEDEEFASLCYDRFSSLVDNAAK